MTQHSHPSDLELAALISSKICHDVIGPVGAIYNAMEILTEDDNEDAKAYALDMIRNVSQQASARLQFARFAFGALGSVSSTIDLAEARKITEGHVGTGKHALSWNGLGGHMGKDRVKLLLNMISCAIAGLPRGGDIDLQIDGTLEKPAFTLMCTGRGARAPNFLPELLDGASLETIEPMSVQAYYTWRLAGAAGMAITIETADERLVLRAV